MSDDRRNPIVDHQTHWYPRAYLDTIVDRDRYPRAVRDGDGYVFEQESGAPTWRFGAAHVDLDLAIADLDAAGIDVMVSSPNTLGEVGSLDRSEAVETIQLLNDEAARAQRERPDRFVGLGMLPIGDVDASIAELDRIVEIGLRGVCLLSSRAGRRIAEEPFWPLFERIGAYGVPLFLHPPHRSLLYSAGFPFGVELGLNWMTDTSTLALDLIFSGVLDRAPGLTVVAPHLGGVLPYLMGRLSNVARNLGLSRPLDECLREHFFADTCTTTPGAMALAGATYGFDRILFATDFPWVPRAMTLDYLAAEIDRDLMRRIQDNAIPGLVPELGAIDDRT